MGEHRLAGGGSIRGFQWARTGLQGAFGTREREGDHARTEQHDDLHGISSGNDFWPADKWTDYSFVLEDQREGLKHQVAGLRFDPAIFVFRDRSAFHELPIPTPFEYRARTP